MNKQKVMRVSETLSSHQALFVAGGFLGAAR